MKIFERIKKDKTLLYSASVLFVTAAATVLGFVLLPNEIFVELFAQGAKPETSKALFLSVGFATVSLSGIMCFVAENVRKWLAAEVVLSLAFVGCIVYNLIVL